MIRNLQQLETFFLQQQRTTYQGLVQQQLKTPFSSQPPPNKHDDERSLSLRLNFVNNGAERGFVKTSATCSENRVVGEVHGREIIAKNRRRRSTRLLQLDEEVLHPLDLRERGGECSLFYFR
ncbi:hypothetical protein PIB30_055211 [Stylosanthes scabra]|uniref:Uncharacterized protein n=1 Tax=Stylosanthes scabra TaxID=79078 RepID=A0ABU6SKP4_9FABA|nr:hypothetical protein [Stylosanthes scabra]